MGREAKRKQTVKDARLTLPKEDYWELRALISAVALVDADAQKLAAELKDRKGKAEARLLACMTRLATAHGFDRTGQYRFEDDTCTLVRS